MSWAVSDTRAIRLKVQEWHLGRELECEQMVVSRSILGVGAGYLRVLR